MKWYLRYRELRLSLHLLHGEEAETFEKRHLTDPSRLEKSIAVLPFINDSRTRKYLFHQRVMEEILQPQKIKDLRSYHAHRRTIQGQKRPISEIAQELE